MTRRCPTCKSTDLVDITSHYTQPKPQFICRNCHEVSHLP